MKAFDIRLERRDTFVIYWRDEKLITLITDKKHPQPCTTNYWNKDTNTFSRCAPLFGDRLAFPTYAISKEDINAFFTVHIMDLIKYGAEQGYLTKDANILILTKEWDDVYEIGFSLHRGEYPIIHQFAQKIADRYLNLKVFW